MNIIWTQTSWAQYVEWQSKDKSIVKKINELIKSICRDGVLEGLGKPEPLKHIKAAAEELMMKTDLYIILILMEILSSLPAKVTMKIS